ncbi:uncharacterized protein LOC141593178 [Silene latifolia]|uniref:uncharacterized protein LOC141593178 n=1 Tax=Silene latifolia TaxID=37657 RepID=UPI003D775D5E
MKIRGESRGSLGNVCVGLNVLGVSDFAILNCSMIALLGKQAWRLVTEPDCLWARVMKARYYYTRDFMTADVGYRPSYTWRSIVGAREVLECGLRKRIGNGRDTRVWGEAWLCSGALTTLDNIARRTRGESPSCYFCQSFSESSLHLFQDCSVARWVWKALGLEGKGCVEGTERGEDLRDWVEGRWGEIEASEYGVFMIGCWAIWEHRNKVVFDGVQIEPDRIVQRIRDVLHEESGNAELRVGCGRRKARNTRDTESEGWKPTAEGYHKINVDAGIKDGEGVSSGVVCRDAGGKVLWGLTVVREAEWDPRFAEAMAMLDGLQEARARGHDRVVLESDCLQVIDALVEKHKGRNSFSLLIADILFLCNSFVSVVWSHTSRINNSVAHALAHILPRVVGKTVWLDVLPPVADSAAVYDLSLMN